MGRVDTFNVHLVSPSISLCLVVPPSSRQDCPSLILFSCQTSANPHAIHSRWNIREFGGGIKFVVAKKADSLYKPVSAASIIAKVSVCWP